jgi:O-methyltransferase
VEHCRHENAIFMGFDSFEGLPEDWGVFKKGEMAFGLESLKVEDPRLQLHKGWFQQTLINALTNLPDDRRNIIHMDADLFSSTLFVLTQLFRYLKKDDIILFDEFSTPTHEFNAFRFFIQSCNIKYKVIAAAGNYTFVVIQIL